MRARKTLAACGAAAREGGTAGWTARALYRPACVYRGWPLSMLRSVIVLGLAVGSELAVHALQRCWLCAAARETHLDACSTTHPRVS